MKLSERAITEINLGQNRTILALSLKVSEQWIYKGLKENKDDGFLTKATALKVIKKVTKLKESEILTEEPVSEVAK